MIKAGNHTVSDKGFTVVMENIGGVPRQAVVAELPGGISDEALAAFCAGPIEVLAEDGSTTATYTGNEAPDYYINDAGHLCLNI